MNGQVRAEHDMNVMLCYPLFDKVFFTEPIGILSLASYLKVHGYEVIVRNDFLYGRSCDEVAQDIAHAEPAVLGVSMTCEREFQDGMILIDNVRSRGFSGYIVTGGDFASFHRKELLGSSLVDAVMVGEGEVTFLEFLEALRHGSDFTRIAGIATSCSDEPNRRSAINNLDSLSFIDRSVLTKIIEQNGGSLKGIQASLPTGRGCYGGCAFCSIWKGAGLTAGGRYREFGIDRIMSEMKYLNESFGIKDFYCCSAQFLPANREEAERRAREYARGVSLLGFTPSVFLYIRCDNVTDSVTRDLKRGCATTLFIGVESFDDVTLDKINKGLTAKEIERALTTLERYGYCCDYRASYRLKLGFIMFTQWTNLEGLRKNLVGCRKFGIPPKKMAYTLQLHEENELVDAHKVARSAMNVGFNELSEDALFVRSGYLRILGELIPPLETMRAFLKAELGLPDEIEVLTWEVVDCINTFAYDAFERLLDMADSKDALAVDALVVESKCFVSDLRVDAIVDSVRRAAAPERLKCVESHLERGLDNPQIMKDETNDAKNPPMVGRIP